MSSSPSLPPRWLWFVAFVACETSPQEGVGDTTRDTATDAPSLSTTCEQIGCPQGPPPVCDAERAASFVTTQVCEDRGDGPKCHPRADTIACDPERTHLCLERECREAPRNGCGWQPSEHTSIIKKFAFADMGEVIDPTTMERTDSCCRDFDGDGTMDNGWSDSVRALQPLIGDANQLYADQIRRGNGLVILDTRELDAPVAPLDPPAPLAPLNDDYVEIVGYFGTYAGGSPGLAGDGNSIFRIQGSSFQRGTWRPVLSAVGAIEDGHFRSSSARFSVILKGTSFYLEVPIKDTRLEGDVTVGAHGELLFAGPHPEGAALSGYLERAELYRAINLDLADQCTCRSVAPDGAPLDPVTGRCNPPADPSCVDPIDFCAALHGILCEPFIHTIPPDFDADGDGAADSFTVGMFFETAPTQHVWIEECDN